jgi:hypothetical protein
MARLLMSCIWVGVLVFVFACGVLVGDDSQASIFLQKFVLWRQ